MIMAKKLRDENSLITNLNDLDVLLKDDARCRQIRASLDKGVSLDDIKKRLHIPILLLHECAITKGNTQYDQAYKDAIIAHHKERANAYFRKQFASLKKTVTLLDEIHFHLILFPVPCKEDIVKDFMARAQIFQADGNN